MVVAICPGSFDPITSGHIDIIQRATLLYDKVVVGVAKCPPKKPLFSAEDRLRFVEAVVSGKDGVTAEIFDSLLIEFAQKHGANIIIRGLRAISDFEHEFQMAQLNRRLSSEIETVFMMASAEYGYLSSSAVKEIAQYGGSIEMMVPSIVEDALQKVYFR
jgi:pantetheine-phosphate adenylyltransferase